MTFKVLPLAEKGHSPDQTKDKYKHRRKCITEHLGEVDCLPQLQFVTGMRYSNTEENRAGNAGVENQFKADFSGQSSLNWNI